VIGHRGAGSSSTGLPGDTNEWPENTIEGIQQAASEGAQLVELDVQLSADGVPVLMHDATIDRTTTGSGCVQSLTAAEIQSFDASGELMPGAGVVVPTFAELIAATTVGLDVEIKFSETDECPAQDIDMLAQAVVDALAADTVEGREVVITSFNAEVLDAVRARNPGLRLGLLSSSLSGVSDAIAGGYEGVAMLFPFITPGAIAEAHDAGLFVYAWTPNTEGDFGTLLALGADGLITDNAPEAIAFRGSFCERFCAPDAGPVEVDAGTTPPPPPGDSGGCGCRAAPSSGPGAGLLLLGLLLPALLVARRRLRRPGRRSSP
jgi:glycerophosphoryl diester phosphodiesterase